MIRAFELVTCRFELVTCGFELLIRGFEIVARRFELGTRNFVFQLVLLSFQLLFLSFQLVTLNSCLTMSPSFLVQTWHFYHKMVATTFHRKEVIAHIKWDVINSSSLRLLLKVWIWYRCQNRNYDHHDEEQLLFYKKVHINTQSIVTRKNIVWKYGP